MFKVVPTTALMVALMSAPALADTYSQLYQFTGGADGSDIFLFGVYGPAYDQKGDLYGVTPTGGTGCVNVNSPCGTVYKLSPAGQLTTLLTFDGTNGASPDGPLTLVNQTLYGSAASDGPGGNGTLFSIHTDGSHYRLLHSFSGLDGTAPVGSLLPGPNGVFYGITKLGGPRSANPHHADNGVLFMLMPDRTYIHLHDFTGKGDGSRPETLSIDAAGTLYGSTPFGDDRNRGGGVVFRYVPSTGVFTVLRKFVPHDGQVPMVGSIGPDGTIYGATYSNGPRGGGTLFQFVPTATGYTFSTLYSFTTEYSTTGPGSNPSGGPILTSSGALVGTTQRANPSLYRYKYNRVTVLHSFPTSNDATPAPPTLDRNGTIYGAVSQYDGNLTCTIGSCGYLYSFLRSP